MKNCGEKLTDFADSAQANNMVGEADSQAGAGEAVLPTELTVLAYNTFLLPWSEPHPPPLVCAGVFLWASLRLASCNSRRPPTPQCPCACFPRLSVNGDDGLGSVPSLGALPTVIDTVQASDMLLALCCRAVMPKTKKKARAQEFCRDHLHRFDVACLTEVWSDRVGRMTKLVKRAAVAEGGHSHRARGKRTVLSLTDGGLMTTSKHPIVRSAAHVYTKSAGMPDSLVANGCV